MAERMPNQAMLIDSLVLQEARASSEIENILTTNDELFKAASDESLPASAEAKEVLRYRQALNHGFREIRERPLATGLFIEIAQLIKQTDFSVRRTPGHAHRQRPRRDDLHAARRRSRHPRQAA